VKQRFLLDQRARELPPGAASSVAASPIAPNADSTSASQRSRDASSMAIAALLAKLREPSAGRNGAGSPEPTICRRSLTPEWIFPHFGERFHDPLALPLSQELS
jgi:hypothetical protein